MKTLNFGWEAAHLNNNGCNLIVPIAQTMTIQKIQVDVSTMFLQPQWGATGYAEVLAGGWVTYGTPVFSGDAHDYNWGPAPWGSPTLATSFHDPNGIGPGGGVSPGALFTFILKTQAPADADRQAVIDNIGLLVNGPATPGGPGNFLVFHMDHAGVPIDCEMQGVLYYTAS